MKSLECVSNYCGLTMLQNKLMISRCRKEKQMYEANAAPSIIKLMKMLQVVPLQPSFI